jgi:hypothetical protein
MAGKFGATSTTDEVLDGVNLSGKRILVTGASAGLGVETARTLAAHGAQVVGAARDLNKARAATEQVRAQDRLRRSRMQLCLLPLSWLLSHPWRRTIRPIFPARYSAGKDDQSSCASIFFFSVYPALRPANQALLRTSGQLWKPNG